MTPHADAGTAAWASTQERSHLWVLKLMRWFALAAGRRMARLVLHPITLYFVLTGGRARRESMRYLERALGRRASWRDVYRHLHTFASTILDRVYLLQGRYEAFELSPNGVAFMDDALAHGEGIFMVGAHMGSFEALRALGLQRGLKVAMVMYEDNARLVNTVLAALGSRDALRTIALGRLDAMLELRRWLDAGGIAGMLGDRTLPHSSQRSHTVVLPFLGQPACFSDGPFRLAAMLKRRVVFMAGLYHGGNRYELRFMPLADFSDATAPQRDALVAQALARYVATIEGLCREAPYNWFNFFDFWADAAARPPADASA